MNAVAPDGQCVGVAALAVGMDNVAMRRAFTAEGIPVVAGTWFTRGQPHQPSLDGRTSRSVGHLIIPNQ